MKPDHMINAEDRMGFEHNTEKLSFKEITHFQSIFNFRS